jgi:hypothetical protein
VGLLLWRVCHLRFDFAHARFTRFRFGFASSDFVHRRGGFRARRFLFWQTRRWFWRCGL